MIFCMADEKIAALLPVVDTLAATDTYELMQIYELRERLIVCQAVIAHLAARKETRWHSFGENTDYPQQSEELMKYVNSRMENGEIKILYRDLITKENTGSTSPAISYLTDKGFVLFILFDQYAGGIGTDYRYSGMSLAKADEKIAALLPVVDTLAATDTYELMQIYELLHGFLKLLCIHQRTGSIQM